MNDRQSARTQVATRAGCTRLGDCPAAFHHEECQRWTDQRTRHHGDLAARDALRGTTEGDA